MSVTIPLKKPITAHDEELTVLTLREPTPEDLIQLGQPQLLIPSADGESVGIEVRPKVIAQYIVRLGGIPLSSVKALGMADFQKASGVVMGFFNAGEE